MKIAHISDLHLGKSLYNYSLIEDQDYILDQITGILVEKKNDICAKILCLVMFVSVGFFDISWDIPTSGYHPFGIKIDKIQFQKNRDNSKIFNPAR